MWREEKVKPELFQSVLVITQRDYMTEAFWNGKRWVSLHNDMPIDIKAWRGLPIFKGICLKNKKKSTHPKNAPKKSAFRMLKRVKYDKNGKMRTL
jgi:hypothetical protein